jgi:hypothetical protein
LVKAGAVADLLLLAGDPLDDLRALDTPLLTVVGGLMHRPQ